MFINAFVRWYWAGCGIMAKRKHVAPGPWEFPVRSQAGRHGGGVGRILNRHRETSVRV